MGRSFWVLHSAVVNALFGKEFKKLAKRPLTTDMHGLLGQTGRCKAGN